MVTSLKNPAEYFPFISSHGKVLVEFFANWCGHCRRIAAFVDTLPPHINVMKVDIDQFPSLAIEENVVGTPTFFVYKDGRKLDQFVGAAEDKFKAFVATHFSAM